MNDLIQKFIEDIDKHEARFSADKQMDKYVTKWLIDKEQLKAVRDQLRPLPLFTDATEEKENISVNG